MAFRITAPAAPGALFKLPPKAKPTMGRAPRQKDGAHLEALRLLPCLGCGTENQSEAAHVRFSCAEDGKSNPGTGQRPDDAYAVPLCAICHADQHAGNERAWWASKNIDPLRAADALYRAPDDETRRQVVFLFRATALVK